MGSLVNAVREMAGVDGKDEIKARLELMLVAAKAKIRGFKDELNEGFMNPAQVELTQVPGKRSIRFIEQYHVASTSSFNQQVADHMQAAISAFFSIGGKADDKKAVQDGLQNLISGALDGFLGSTEAGESEEKIYIVVPENNAFIRADICLWKYHLSDQSLASNTDTAIAYVLCKSVIDHSKLSIDELIYFATDAMSKRTPIAVAAPEIEFGDTIQAVKTAAAAAAAVGADKVVTRKALTAAVDQAKGKLPAGFSFVFDTDGSILLGGGESPSPVLLSRLDSHAPVNSDPASLTAVEAYIEEMIRVWKKLKAADA